MALDQSTLKDALVDVATNFPTTHDEAAQRWAEAYGSTYAANGQSPTGNSPVVDAAVQVLKAALAVAFASSDAAPQMTAAFVAFWFAPPVVFAGPFPGVVTAIGAGPDLASVFRQNIDNAASVDEACGAIAAELHAFTLTCVITDATTPSPTIGPIT